MKTYRITRKQFAELRKLAEKRHWRWPAVFSTNSKGELWPWMCNGRTPESERKDVRGISSVLDHIISAYIALREEGGRLFIKNDRVSWKDAGGNERTLFIFEFDEPEKSARPQPTFKELRAIQAQKAQERMQER